ARVQNVMRRIVSQCANCARSEETVRYVCPVSVAREALVRLPDTAAGSADPHNAVLRVAGWADRKCSDPPRSIVGKAMPVKERRIACGCGTEREPRRCRVFTNTAASDRGRRGLRAGDVVGRDLVTAVQLVILVDPRRRAFACFADVREQFLSVLCKCRRDLTQLGGFTIWVD